MVAEILEQQHVTVAQVGHGVHSGRPDAIVGERDGRTEYLGQPSSNGRETVRGIALPLRSTEMAHQDHARAAAAELLNRRQRRADTRVVAHGTVLVDRHVQIDAHEHASALHVADLRESPPRHA